MLSAGAPAYEPGSWTGALVSCTACSAASCPGSCPLPCSCLPGEAAEWAASTSCIKRACAEQHHQLNYSSIALACNSHFTVREGYPAFPDGDEHPAFPEGGKYPALTMSANLLLQGADTGDLGQIEVRQAESRDILLMLYLAQTVASVAGWIALG